MKVIIPFVCCAFAALGCSSTSDPAPANASGSADGGADACSSATPDQDGVAGGTVAFKVSITDSAFAPIILKAQNLATVTLTLTNTGTKPHDFVMQCMADSSTPSCPFCFSGGANVPALAPGASAAVTFTVPQQEGIYNFTSDLPGDAATGQFVVQ